MPTKVQLNQIKLDERFYPRRSNGAFEIDQETVNNYKLNLEFLPPITLSKDFTLIDGYHRYLAHRDSGKNEIEAEILDIPESQYLIEAIKRNAIHGLQLKPKQKRYWAQQLCEDGLVVKDIATLLAVSSYTVEEWTREIRTKQKDKRSQHIMEHYLACQTEDEIAKEVGLESKQSVNKIISQQKQEIAKKLTNPPVNFQPYTLLKFSSADSRYGREYPGRMPGQVMEHLLWYYTQPFDIILDPMAGGGTTVDVCKAMYRRYQAYDIIKDDSKEIQFADITKGVACKLYFKPQLIILDPPYWSQKKGTDSKAGYENSKSNLANMSLDDFYSSIENIIKESVTLLINGGFLALIISPSQVDKQAFDHIFPLKTILDKYLTYQMRFIVPYTTQQVSGADVKQAKDDKYPLKLHRDLLVYKKC